MPLGPIEPPWDQRLARALVRPLRHTRVTPNAITTVALAQGLLAAWLFALGGSAAHWGALLLSSPVCSTTPTASSRA